MKSAEYMVFPLSAPGFGGTQVNPPIQSECPRGHSDVGTPKNLSAPGDTQISGRSQKWVPPGRLDFLEEIKSEYS